MSKKCPFVKVITSEGIPYDYDVTTITEQLGDCVESDCPYYTPDTDAPSFCFRAQRPNDDAPGTTRSIGFDALKNYSKS